MAIYNQELIIAYYMYWTKPSWSLKYKMWLKNIWKWQRTTWLFDILWGLPGKLFPTMNIYAKHLAGHRKAQDFKMIFFLLIIYRLYYERYPAWSIINNMKKRTFSLSMVRGFNQSYHLGMMVHISRKILL